MTRAMCVFAHCARQDECTMRDLSSLTKNQHRFRETHISTSEYWDLGPLGAPQAERA